MFNPHTWCRDGVLKFDQAMIERSQEEKDIFRFFDLCEVARSIDIAFSSDFEARNWAYPMNSQYCHTIAEQMVDSKTMLKSLYITDFIIGDQEHENVHPLTLQHIIDGIRLSDDPQYNPNELLPSILAYDPTKYPAINLTELFIVVIDERAPGPNFNRIPVPWVDMRALLNSTTLTTLDIDWMRSNIDEFPVGRLQLIECLPNSLTSLRLSISMITADEQQKWISQLAKPDFLPHIRIISLFGCLFTDPALSTTMISTKTQRPYEKLNLQWVDESLTMSNFTHLTQLYLMVFRETAVSFSCLYNCDSMPHLKQFAYIDRYSGQAPVGKTGLSPLIVFLSKRPLKILRFHLLSFEEHEEWSSLSDEAISSLSLVSSLQVFEYDVVRISRVALGETRDVPFESEDLSTLLPAHCWPNVHTLSVCGLKSVNQFEMLLRACPASTSVTSSAGNLCRLSCIMNRLLMIDAYCPMVSVVKFDGYCTIAKTTIDDITQCDNITFHFPHLSHLLMSGVSVDDKCLHYLLKKVNHCPIQQFDSSLPGTIEMTKFRIMVHDLLPKLQHIRFPPYRPGYFDEFTNIQQYQYDDAGNEVSGFPLLPVGADDALGVHAFALTKNEQGETGRQVWFRRIWELLSDEETHKFCRWSEGNYSDRMAYWMRPNSEAEEEHEDK